ncbi:outer-membrane lipoprotein carrier protein [Gammaproteobacteria bacterium]|nr:outer-membrane lipoprotein carrier protein [Gammaproteobacteria bacterium]
MYNIKYIFIKTMLYLSLIFSISLVNLGFADVNFLDQYFLNLQTLESSFTQTVKQGKKSEQSSGLVFIKQGVGFRFIYETPFKQEIILNKAQNKLWEYDLDLAQVIIKKVNLKDQESPIAFLLTKEALSTSFNIKVLKNKLSYRLTPKTKDESIGIKTLNIIFKNNNLNELNVIDDTGSNIIIKLVKPKFNQDIVSSQFVLITKSLKNVDIIDETK